MEEIPVQMFKRFRFPSSIIQHVVWLYFTCPLSFRDVELLLAQRQIVVSHETIRTWCYRFGPYFAKKVGVRLVGSAASAQHNLCFQLPPAKR